MLFLLKSGHKSRKMKLSSVFQAEVIGAVIDAVIDGVIDGTPQDA